MNPNCQACQEIDTAKDGVITYDSVPWSIEDYLVEIADITRTFPQYFCTAHGGTLQ